jgi:tRNA(Arg) A34 adenosine deaminase TadA
MASLDHERFMRRAIALTANCYHLPFGALIVCAETGEVVAEGWNKSAINPTWHGEIDALNRLAESGRGDRGSGLVL